MSETIKIEFLPERLRKLLADTGDACKELIAKKFMGAPTRFLREAQEFYPHVLRRPTGRLIGSFGGGA